MSEDGEPRLEAFIFALRIEFRPPSSSGLGHRPFTAAARVRIPLGVHKELVRQAEKVW